MLAIGTTRLGVGPYFKKYCNPVLRFSKNFGRNLDITLFGGIGGIAAVELGNVCSNFSRRSSNSEYRFRILIEPPFARSVSVWIHITALMGTYMQSLHSNVPNHKCANTRSAPIYDNMILYINIFRPASFIFRVLSLLVCVIL